MKKIFTLFLALALLFLTACNTKPSVVTESSSSSIKAESTPSVTPPDEETILHTASTASDDGVTLKIAAHGYRSKSSRLRSPQRSFL